MIRTFFIALLLAAAVGSAPAVAVAQETNTTSNATTTDEETNSVSIQLSDMLTLTDWRVEDGTFVLTFDASIPSSVAVTDSGALMSELADGSGTQSTDVPYRRYTLTSGTTTIRFDATAVDGEMAVSVGSSDSVKLLQTDSMRADQPPVERGAVQLLVLATAAVVGFGAVVAVKRKRDKEEIGVKRLE